MPEILDVYRFHTRVWLLYVDGIWRCTHPLRSRRTLYPFDAARIAAVPRFLVFLTSAAHHSAYYRHVNVVELRPGVTRLPSSVRSREVKQVLLRTIPLRIDVVDNKEDDGPAIQVFTRAEKIIEKLNNMMLSLQIADMEDAQGNNGVKNLFNHLWKMETDDECTTPENHAHP